MSALEATWFMDDPWWLVLVKAVLLLVILLMWTIINVWFERRVFARMLNRLGPNMNGPFGLWQTIAEGVKCLLKEDFSPAKVDKWVYNIAPLLTGMAAFSVWTVIPFTGDITMFGVRTRGQLMDMPVAVLLVLAITSIGVYGTVLAGWSSSESSSYSLLGGLRSSAQMISYEVSMGLSLVSVFMWAGSMSTHEIVEAQVGHLRPGGMDIGLPGWFALLLIPSAVIYFISLLGEANRTPFDLSECEQELVSGHITEYTGFRYALYYLGEYIAMATAAGLFTTFFLGGYHAPWPFNLVGAIDTGYWGLLWFFLKGQVVIFCIIWIRASLPRLRYDQFMALGWKWLIPISLVWIMCAATFKLAINDGWLGNPVVMGVLAAIIVLLLVWSFLAPSKPAEATAATAAPAGPFDAFAGGYPVPPLPGQTLPELADVVRSTTEPTPEKQEV